MSDHSFGEVRNGSLSRCQGCDTTSHARAAFRGDGCSRLPAAVTHATGAAPNIAVRVRWSAWGTSAALRWRQRSRLQWPRPPDSGTGCSSSHIGTAGTTMASMPTLEPRRRCDAVAGPPEPTVGGFSGRGYRQPRSGLCADKSNVAAVRRLARSALPRPRYGCSAPTTRKQPGRRRGPDPWAWGRRRVRPGARAHRTGLPRSRSASWLKAPR